MTIFATPRSARALAGITLWFALVIVSRAGNARAQITRDGTPIAQATTSATSLVVAIPASASVGDTCVIEAITTVNGVWGAAPGNFAVVASTTQTAAQPESIMYAETVPASGAGSAGSTVTVTAASSGSLNALSYCYTGTAGVDVANTQRNGASTTATTAALSGLSAANDLLVATFGINLGATAACSSPTTGLNVWNATAGDNFWDLYI